jgi:transcriptional regulator with XRE-family HTH domain
MNKQLLQARIARRWTITVAAQRIGIGRSTYVRWEQGLQFPRQSGLMLACKAFNLSPEQLGFPLVAPYEVPSDALALPLSPALRQETMWRLNTQTFLDQQEETAKLAGQQKIVYACLEVEIMAMALHWKKLSGSLLVLQQLISESIRKYDAMHQDDTRQETGLTRRQALQAIALLPIQLYGLTHLPRLASQLSPEEMLPPLRRWPDGLRGPASV